MSTNANWGEVDILIPHRFHQARVAAQSRGRSDCAALIEALPTASEAVEPVPSSYLAEADVDQCRAWVARVIRALPTKPAPGAMDDLEG